MLRYLFKSAKFTVTAFIILAVWSITQLTDLPLSLYPNTANPVVMVTFQYEGDREHFYQTDGKSLERILKKQSGVSQVESTYRQNWASLLVHFNWNVSPAQAKEKIENITHAFSSPYLKRNTRPSVNYFDPSSENYVAIQSEHLTEQALVKLLKNELEPKLEQIPNVGGILISSQSKTSVEVLFKPYKLAQYNLTLDSVLYTLRETEKNTHLGRVNSPQIVKNPISLVKTVHSVEELKVRPVANKEGQLVRLGDVAQITETKHPTNRYFLLDDSPTVAVAIWPIPGANLYDVSKAFVQALDELVAEQQSKGNLSFKVLNNPKRFIDDAILSIVIAVGFGALCGAFIVLLFFRKFSTAIIISLTMPLAVMLEIWVMKIWGVGINLLSLGGLSISIGMVVDASILIVDKLERRRKTYGSLNQHHIYSVVSDLLPPLLVSTVTTILVFIPLIYTESLAASLLTDTALTAIGVLVIALLLSTLFVPALYILFNFDHLPQSSAIKNKEISIPTHSLFTQFLSSVKIRFALAFAIILLFAGVFYGSYALYHKIDKEIVASPKAEIIDVQIIFDQTAVQKDERLPLIKELRSNIEADLKDKIKFMLVDMNQYFSYISVHLNSYKDTEFVENALREAVPGDERYRANVSPWVTSALSIQALPQLTLNIKAASKQLAYDALVDISEFIKEKKGIQRLSTNPRISQSKNVSVIIKSKNFPLIFTDKSYHSTVKSLEQYIAYLGTPKEITSIHINDEETPLMLSAYGDITTSDNIEQLPIVIDNQVHMMHHLVQLGTTEVQSEKFLINSRETNKIELWLDEGQVSKESLIKEVSSFSESLAGDISLIWEDESTTYNKNISSLYYSFGVSLVGVFLVLLLFFRSFRVSLVALLQLSFALFGGLVSLFLMQSTISLNALLGLLILIGLAINNSIIIIDAVYKAYRHTNHYEAAIVFAIKSRTRSLVATNLTTIIGMFPIAYGFGAGQDILKPLGIVLVGGLFVSTLLSFVILPVMLSFQNRIFGIKNIIKKESAIHIDLPND